MKLHAPIFISLLCMPIIASAASVPADSLDLVDRSVNELISASALFSPIYSNPAMNGLRRPYSFSYAGIEWGLSDNRHGKPYNPALGDGEMHGSFMAETYLKHKQSTLTGFAGYTTGKIRSMEWCETSDYDIVYPYVMADEVGGDMNEEIYRFGGGISSSNGRWHYGAALSYKAGLYYRNIDPRPRNVTGLLNLSVGSGVSAGNYLVALGLNADKYKQTNSVEFMSELGSAKIYHLTGLGTDYVRFAGSGASTYYTGWRYGAAVDLHPDVNKSGFTAHVGLHRFTFTNILSDLNKLPLAKVREMDYMVSAGWLGPRFAVNTFANVIRRLGDENIFGDATSGSYPQIATLTLYAHNRVTTGAEISAVALQHNTVGLRLLASAMYEHDNQVQSSADARRIVNNMHVALTCSAYLRTSDRTLLSTELGYGHRKPVNNSFEKPTTGAEGAINAADMRFLTDSHRLNQLTVSMTLVQMLPHKLALRISADGAITTLSRCCSMSAAILF